MRHLTLTLLILSILNLNIIPYISLATEANAGVVKEQCLYSGETDFFPIGDERGNSLLTKKEIHRDCNITITTQGPCKKWEEKNTEFFLDPSDYNTYKTNNNNGSLGEMLAAIGAYDQIGHFWSGWKGYCERGTKYDFSWAEDPMFWASLAMSVIMDGTKEGGFLDGGAIDGAMDSAASATGNAFTGLADSIGMEFATEAAKKAFGQCLIAAGVDMASNIYNYFKPDEESDCDPVDEFCEEDVQDEESDIMTIDQQQYDDMIADNPDFADYIEILKEEDGILTIKFKKPNEFEDFDKKSQEEMEEARQKIKNMQFAISSAMTAAKMAACIATDGSTGSSANMGSGASTGDRFSVKDGLGMAINSLPADWLGPYGALIKAALTIALEFINSFKDIDTCYDEDDAKEAGSRHLKTYETLPYNLCQPTKQVCAQKEFFGSDCGLDGFFYCCYDQMLTKILVAQIKAELGRDWAHCTGITLRDLNFVSFRQCRAEEMKLADDGTNFDGTKIILKYDEDDKLVSPADWSDAKWLQSFQHKHKCIDLTEFKKYLESTFSQDIDFSDFDAIFQDTSEQIEPIPN